ncbi:MAG: DUF960 family protein [Saccharofermentanales bacterium]
MFESDKFITRGVADQIPPGLQAFMWKSIGGIPCASRDYLQVFRLSACRQGCSVQQEIVHTQEQPEYSARYLMGSCTRPVCAKVFVIDDTTHATMLLAEEY